jgi:hypothetical protein
MADDPNKIPQLPSEPAIDEVASAAECLLSPTATREGDQLLVPLDIGAAGVPNPQRVPGTGNHAVHPLA